MPVATLKEMIADIIKNCPSATETELKQLSAKTIEEIHYAIYHD